MHIAVLSGVLLATTVVPVVMAGQQHKPASMTCEEFLSLDDSIQPNIVYWSEGFNKKGNPTEAVIDFDTTDELIPTIITECQKTPKASFWQKIKNYF
jgi:acid stress chaperone HdeA